MNLQDFHFLIIFKKNIKFLINKYYFNYGILNYT